MTYLEVMPSQVTFRWGLEKFRLREVKASVVDVVGEDEVAAKTAALERKERFSRRSRSSYGSSLMPLTIRVARRCMHSIKVMSR